MPLTDNPGRIVVAISTLKKLGELREYPYDEKRRNSDSSPAFLWERFAEHSLQPENPQGFVIPFDQISEYITKHPETEPDELLLIVPDIFRWEFSYATERLSSESVIIILNRAIALTDKYSELGFASPAGASWSKVKKWLKAELYKTWREKDIYPGLGAVLNAFGLNYGVDIAKAIRSSASDPDNPWIFIVETFKNFNAFKKILPENLLPVLKLKDRTGKYLITPDKLAIIASNLEKNPDFWDLLSRVNLSPEQVRLLKLALDGQMSANCPPQLTNLGHFLKGTSLVDAILANPYILYEQTRLLEEKFQIRLEQIDLAMFPPDDIAETVFADVNFDRVEYPDDRRRLRALSTWILETEAQRGHTLVPFDMLIAGVNTYRPEILPEPLTAAMQKDNFDLHRDFYREIIEEREIILKDEENAKQTIPVLQLRRYEDAEAIIRDFVNSRLEKNSLHMPSKNWLQKVREELGGESSSAHPEKEEKSIGEKAEALEKLFDSPLSVLTGVAGAGKTTTLAILCADKDVQERGILILAPPGKARMVLSSRLKAKGIKHKAQTIYQFLLGCRHAAYRNYLPFATGKSIELPDQTIIIDEISMITEDAFAALCDALKNAERVIFAGDPNQLAPIGAGKPFYELCNRLASQEGNPHYADLKIPNRQNCGDDIEGVDTIFARFFTGDGNAQDRDVIADTVSTPGPVEFVYCPAPEELGKTLIKVMEKVMSETNGLDNTEYPLLNFDLSLGASVTINKKYPAKAYVNFNDPEGVEKWQILTPYRNRPHVGNCHINQLIHGEYALEPKRANNMFKFVAPEKYRHGPEGIVAGEKVINVKNASWNENGTWIFDGETHELYTANGDIGVVSRYERDKKNNIIAHDILFSS